MWLAERLGIMAETNDGFKIAEKDLELRGPGELLGTRQSGLPEFRIANLVRDQKILDAAKKEADFYLGKGERSPETAKMIQRVALNRALRPGCSWIKLYPQSTPISTDYKKA